MQPQSILNEPAAEPETVILGPITPEEYERRQKQIRRVVDPITGRIRLVRGEGEIIESIVTREQQRQINKMATFNDGLAFQRASMRL